MLYKRRTTIPKGSRVQAIGTRNAKDLPKADRDIVYSAWQHAAVHKRTGCSVARQLNKMSCDIILGIPYNHAGSAWLLSAVAAATGYTAGVLTHMMTNAHIYENHMEAAIEHLSRKTTNTDPVVLRITHKHDTHDTKQAIKMLENVDYTLCGYAPQGRLPFAPMAV